MRSSGLISNLRRQVAQLYRKYEVLYILINGVDAKVRKLFNATKANIPKLSRPQLKALREKLRQEIKELRSRYGAKALSEVYEMIVSESEKQPRPFLLLTKFEIERKLFTHYERVYPGFHKLPAHARIGIDVHGTRPSRELVEIYILEVMLYEDMCALFNLAKRYEEMAAVPNSTKLVIKEVRALKHACVAAAFSFAEAYLNGIAFDFYIENDAKLSDNEKQMLTEWNIAAGRPRFVSLRDKFLQYTRIIKGLKHPPLQESNCPELEFFLDRAKLLRDSVTHASPKPGADWAKPVKERVYLDIEIGDCEMVVDTAIALVRRIETEIHGNEHRLDWLKNRGSEGLFDDSVFS